LLSTLKLKYDELVSKMHTFAFNFNLRPCMLVAYGEYQAALECQLEVGGAG